MTNWTRVPLEWRIKPTYIAMHVFDLITSDQTIRLMYNIFLFLINLVTSTPMILLAIKNG
jgi:hypothetical protein